MQPDIIAHLVGPLAALLVVATSLVLILRGPLGRALARRIEGSRGTDHEAAHRLDDVEARLQTVELTQERMLELEERLDFAERLLAQGQPEQLQPGKVGAQREDRVG